MMKLIYEFDGEERELPIPADPSDLTFAQWCDFKSAEAVFLDPPGKDEDTGSDEYGQRKAMELQAALTVIYGPNVSDIPETAPGDDGTVLLEEGFIMEIGAEVSALRLYAHIVTLIQRYVPKEIPKLFKLTHRGQKFRLKMQKTGRILAKKPLSMGEGIEVMEYQRRAAASMKNAAPKDIGNIEFTLGLTEFALLVRKPGEQLPADPGERDRFIADRRRLFASLRMDQVLSLRYFFLNALHHCNRKQHISSFGKARPSQRSGGGRKLTRRKRK